MAVPTITEEQRAAALEKARLARQARKAVKDAVSAGEMGVADVLAMEDEAIKRMKVLDLAKSLPGVGDKRAAALLERCGIAEGRRVGGLGSRQAKALADACRPM